MPPFREMVEHLPDGVTWHEPDGRYAYLSRGFLDLLGYEDGTLEGVSPYDLFHDEDVGRIRSVHEEILATGEAFRVTYRIRRVDATYLWVESTGRFVPGSGLEDPGIVVATRDVEARRSLLTLLENERSLRDRLEEMGERQRAFLTTIAHRTRTPLTSVLGFARTLAEHPGHFDPDRQAELIQRLAVNAERLAEVIEQATTYERLARGDVAVRRRPVVVSRLVDEVLAEVADVSAAPISVEVASGLVVMADEDKLHRALSVLLHNAVVHTPPGTRMWVRAARGDGHVDVTVEDAGPGVRDELKETVFEPFIQGDTMAEHDPGMGLGLSLVAMVAAQHGGRAWVEDRDGSGAAFHVRISDTATELGSTGFNP